jgi:guanylate kinase
MKVIQEKLDSGIDVLLDIEVQGASQVRIRCPEAVLIFIIPPSLEELSRRLYNRNTESEEVIAGRLNKAREEYREIPNYDYVVINDKISVAAEEISSILTAESCRTRNRLHLIKI